ncbi:transcription factor bHLH149-like [Glycine soja]|uniref:transcription factor bHLH149-like n=1 Tax=Glycine soja TaxID=3848 RepID=UPI000E21B8D6|nr:transcription factor bHLH149-like [Glycine soja]|eukprot:XP_025981543.1 transcription factor bHLH149-like [Glycine max]
MEKEHLNVTRRKITHQNSLTLTPWTSHTEHRLYSSNLLHALRRNNNPTSALQVRATADRVLAATTKGRTRWSRAILANSFGRWRKQKQRHHKKVKNYSANKCMKKTTPEIRRRLPAVQKKAHVLRKLIPSCRKVSFPKLLFPKWLNSEKRTNKYSQASTSPCNST